MDTNSVVERLRKLKEYVDLLEREQKANQEDEQ